MERTRPERAGEEGEPLEDVRQPRAQSSSSSQAGAGSQLTADETQRLLRRAAELERSRGQSQEVALDFREVERIALEAGLSREAIQRAFAELRTGALETPAPPGFADRWMGPASVSVHTLSPLAPEDARKKLHAILKGELLHPEERKGLRTTWTPAPGLWASIQRGLNWRGQAAWQQGSVVSLVSEAPPGMDDAKAMVRLEASSGDRSKKLWASLIPLGVCVPLTIISAFAPHALEQGIPLLVGGMGLAGSGFAFTLIRFAYRKRIREMKIALERVVDKLSGLHDDE